MLITDYQNDKEKELVANALQKHFSDLLYFYFRHSKILENAMRNAMSFIELAKANPLSKLVYKNFMLEYNRLLALLQAASQK